MLELWCIVWINAILNFYILLRILVMAKVLGVLLIYARVFGWLALILWYQCTLCDKLEGNWMASISRLAIWQDKLQSCGKLMKFQFLYQNAFIHSFEQFNYLTSIVYSYILCSPHGLDSSMFSNISCISIVSAELKASSCTPKTFQMCFVRSSVAPRSFSNVFNMVIIQLLYNNSFWCWLHVLLAFSHEQWTL